MQLKILSLNVRGLGSPSKVNSLCNELNFLNFDIALLQETHVSCPKQADLGGANATGPSGPVNRPAWPFCSRLTFLALSNDFFSIPMVAS